MATVVDEKAILQESSYKDILITYESVRGGKGQGRVLVKLDTSNFNSAEKTVRKS